jgi:uncharacterized SAM-binding protein YcdF (DUF218 family)
MTEAESKKEFLLLPNYKNEFPPVNIDVVYVFSGVEKHRLVGSSLDRLQAGVKLWRRLKHRQRKSPIFLFQGSRKWLNPVKKAFANKMFDIPKKYLRLELQTVWDSTLDQFQKIPPDLESQKNWVIVTSPWHIPRVKRYAQKYWTDKLVYYWSSPLRPEEFAKYFPMEIEKIIAYAKKGNL